MAKFKRVDERTALENRQFEASVRGKAENGDSYLFSFHL